MHTEVPGEKSLGEKSLTFPLDLSKIDLSNLFGDEVRH
jgi:hypothetical protein